MQSSPLPEVEKESLWTRFVVIGLGLWLIATSLSFAHKSELVVGNDIVCGLLLIACGLYWVYSRSTCVQWVIALIGVWLQFAPLALWAPMPMSYLNDTLIGVLAIALSVVIPRSSREESLSQNSIPPGWSYNPSAWLQRIPIIFLGFFAWMFARYMTAYQLGYLETIWDPVFGDGTLKVITSSISHDFPVPDAGLGAMAYTLETLMAAHGGTSRWHTLPWFVVLFAILVIPLGFVSIVLIMLQPIMVGYWCFWCLLTAVCMLFMIALAIDEVVAVMQYLRWAKKQGYPLKETFWRGGPAPEATPDTRSPDPNQLSFNAMHWGISVPWNLVITAFLGGWLMFSPHFLGVSGLLADADHVIGALTVAFSVIAMAEVVRSWRFGIVLLGIALLGFALLIKCDTRAIHVFVGVALIFFSFRKGKIYDTYGSVN